MARTSSWTGWIAFADWLMIIIGSIDFFEGLIAVIRNQYYLLRGEAGAHDGRRHRLTC
jgi:hypothetical protein